MKLILFLFICYGVVWLSVWHSQRALGQGIITIEQPEASPDPDWYEPPLVSDPHNRYSKTLDRFPKRYI